MFHHKRSFQNWTGRWKLRGVLVPDLSSFAFLIDFKWDGIKPIQLTLVQSLGKPPLLSQEHKPQALVFTPP